MPCASVSWFTGWEGWQRHPRGVLRNARAVGRAPAPADRALRVNPTLAFAVRGPHAGVAPDKECLHLKVRFKNSDKLGAINDCLEPNSRAHVGVLGTVFHIWKEEERQGPRGSCWRPVSQGWGGARASANIYGSA